MTTIPANDRHRIIYTNFHTEYGGGHETFILSLAQRLADAFDVNVVCPAGSSLHERCRSLGIAVSCCPFSMKLKRPGDVMRTLAAFKRIVNDFHPHLVHSNAGNDNTVAAWCKAVSVRRRFGLVRTHHATRRIPADPYHYWLYSMVVDANVYVSQTSATVSQNGGLRPRRSQVIVQGVDTEHFCPCSKDGALATSLGIKPGDFVLGSCAGLADYKRVDLMLEAVASVSSVRPVKVLLVGRPENARPLMDQAQSLGIRDRVIFAGFHEDVRPYVSLFDVGFLLSDRVETISYGVREMLSMGIPVLSSSYSGLVENVQEGFNGWFVPPGDLAATRQALERILALSRESWSVMSQNARADAVARFSVHQQMDQIRCLYKKLLLKYRWD